MRILHDLEHFQPDWEAAALTLGVFDGIHRGHQSLIKRLYRRSSKGGRARLLLTYHPHPDFVLGKRKAERGAELFTYQEKLSLFQKYDLDAVIFLKFTKELSQMTALRYLKDILLEKLRARRIIIGYDQHFGRGRRGNYKFLKKMSYRYDFKVERIAAVRYRKQIIGTSAIRRSLQEGDIKRANKMLGYDFFIRAIVKRGFQRGQRLGFPTANLELPRTKVIPAVGVYAGIAEWGGRRFRAMINVGNNPTFGSNQLGIEVHLLDFNANLYGDFIRVCFRRLLRQEMRFPSAEELKARLEKDRLLAARIKL